jgi:hypothetical protein
MAVALQTTVAHGGLLPNLLKLQTVVQFCRMIKKTSNLDRLEMIF